MDGERSRVLGRVISLISTNISRLISWYTLIVPEVEVITWEGDTLNANGPVRVGKEWVARSDLLCSSPVVRA
jgi:hypothetical protein